MSPPSVSKLVRPAVVCLNRAKEIFCHMERDHAATVGFVPKSSMDTNP
jgi:hypothetical protein